jgi:hypothetical protein
MMSRLSRRHGESPLLPELPGPLPARALFAVALENAVEGCVHETCAAVAALLESQCAPERTVRRAMRAIATDECRHAQLAWDVAAWARPRLSAEQVRRIDGAMRDAVAEVRSTMPHVARLLEERLWGPFLGWTRREGAGVPFMIA